MHANRILDREIHNRGQMDLLKPAKPFRYRFVMLTKINAIKIIIKISANHYFRQSQNISKPKPVRREDIYVTLIIWQSASVVFAVSLPVLFCYTRWNHLTHLFHTRSCCSLHFCFVSNIKSVEKVMTRVFCIPFHL